MPYLPDYLYFTSGTECSPSFRTWSGLSLLGAIAGQQYWIQHGRYEIHPPLYICLVAHAGAGKSTARKDVRKILAQAFPTYPISSSFQSHQDIIDLMCNLEPVTWERRNGDGVTVEIRGYTPFYIIANELASLLSTDKKGMVDFLVDGYDDDEISTGYKGMRLANPERKQRLDNPHVSLLACAVPKWFMGNLRQDLFDLGLGRRLVVVYDEKSVEVDDPKEPPGAKECRAAVIEHLKLVQTNSGEVVRTPAAWKWWKDWYYDKGRKNKTDPILMQFHETHHIQLLKVALGLSLSENPKRRVIESEHLEYGYRLLKELEPGILRLTSGIGRNELAGVGAQLLDYLDRVGRGASSMHQVRLFFGRYLRADEFNEVINQYLETQQLVIAQNFNGMGDQLVMLPYFYENTICKRTPDDPNVKAYLAKKAARASTASGITSLQNEPTTESPSSV